MDLAPNEILPFTPESVKGKTKIQQISYDELSGDFVVLVDGEQLTPEQMAFKTADLQLMMLGAYLIGCRKDVSHYREGVTQFILGLDVQ